MKRLLAIIALCVPVCLIAQGFGAFGTDQPFFAQDVTSSIPGVPPALSLWWSHGDISSNNPVSAWNDRIVGFQLVQDNTVYRPTNSVNGVCFDGTKSMEFISTLKIPTNSSVFVSGYFSAIPHNQILVYSTNGNEGLYINATNQIVTRYGNADYGLTTALNPTNFVSFGYTTETNGTNLKLVTYINGSQVSSNYFSGTSSSLDTVGGWSGYQVGTIFGRLDYSLYGYITDLMVWTNSTLVPENFVYLHAAVSATNNATLAPFFNPNSIAGMFEWWRADDPMIGSTSRGSHTNNVTVGVGSESFNLTPDAATYFAVVGSPKWLESAGASGRAALMHVSTSRFYHNANYGSDVNQPYIFFCVLQSTNATAGAGNQAAFYTGFGGNTIAFYPSVSAGSMQVYASTAATFPFPYTITNTTVFTVYINGANTWVRTNGVLAGNISGNAGTAPFHQSLVIANDTGGSPIEGYMYELMGYSFGSMTTNDIINIENSLKAKYFIP